MAQPHNLYNNHLGRYFTIARFYFFLINISSNTCALVPSIPSSTFPSSSLSSSSKATGRGIGRSISSLLVLHQSSSNSPQQEQINEEIEKLMSKHDPILLYASRLLPRDVAMDASALYAWCRRLDEITDNPQQQQQQQQQHVKSAATTTTTTTTTTRTQIQEQLKEWEYRFNKLYEGEPFDSMDEALYECLQRNPQIGKEPFVDMIEGMKADVNVVVVDVANTSDDSVEAGASGSPQQQKRSTGRRIDSLQELETYGYQVAGTVGLMLLPLLLRGSSNNEQSANADAIAEAAKEPAVALGKAIQIINILRDATQDAAMDRIYLPQDLLLANGVIEQDILNLSASEGYCNVVQQVSYRAEELLQEAEIGGKAVLPGLGPLFVQIIIELYRGYLEQLEKMRYNNLIPTTGGEEQRVKISTTRKLIATVKALWKFAT